MAASDRYTGTNLVIHFIHSGGTANLSGDWRSLSVTRQQNVVNLTAGSDTVEYNKGTYKTVSATLETLFVGTAGASTYGSATLNKEGTLNYYPNGTASGQPMGQFACVVTEASPDFSYDGEVTVSFSFAAQGSEGKNPMVDTV